LIPILRALVMYPDMLRCDTSRRFIIIITSGVGGQRKDRMGRISSIIIFDSFSSADDFLVLRSERSLCIAEITRTQLLLTWPISVDSGGSFNAFIAIIRTSILVFFQHERQ